MWQRNPWIAKVDPFKLFGFSGFFRRKILNFFRFSAKKIFPKKWIR